MRRAIGIAVVVGMLAMPAPALALRYASPTGMSADNCQTVGTACDLETAIEGTGGNLPSMGEEVIVLQGDYAVTTEIEHGASGLNVHGAFDQPRPVINETGSGQLRMTVNGTYSYLDLEYTGTDSALLMNTGTAERLFIRGSGGSSALVCQCYGGLLRDSVVVTTGTSPALGVRSSGGTSTVTYRNVTAYSSNAAAPAIKVLQNIPPNSLNVTAFNTIARNGAGGTDVVADGTGASITFSRSNYGTSSAVNGGVVQDTGDPHQTALPLFTNAAGGDFSEVAGSPTIDAGLTDVLNGSLDFAGNPRTVGGSTDIGAYEFQGSSPSPIGPVPLAPPSFNLIGTKVKINPKGKGALGFSCTSPATDQCVVAGALSTGAAKQAARVAKTTRLGQVSGTVPGGGTGKLTVKLTKAGRSRLARKGKLRASLLGSVTNQAGLSSALAATLTLKAKR
jgi:hypothetical protein